VSETPNTPLPCEQLLDYVYGELDEAQKQAFEAHLATCARCQTEAASFGRVRTAMKRIFPAVEPTEKLGGALHQQLLHQAAQRSRRGVLLAFPRKLVEHPAWAAAAMFAIVGGAIVINWSHERAIMPAGKPEAAPAAVAKTEAAPADNTKAVLEEKTEAASGTVADPKPTAAAQAPTATTLPMPPPAPPLKLAEPKEEAKKDADHARVAVAGKSGEDASEVSRSEAQAPVATPAHHNKPSRRSAAPLAEYKSATKSAEPSFGLGGEPSGRSGGDSAGFDGLTRGAGGKDGKKGYLSSAPVPTTPPASSAQEPVAGGVISPREQVNGAIGSRARDSYGQKAKLESAVQSPAGPSRDVEGLRKHAGELTTQGRCVEAIKAYEMLARQSQYVSPQERANWAHCLNTLGNREAAQRQLDQLRADKRASNAVLQKVEGELDQPAQQERMAAKRQPAKKAKAAAPAAPADDEVSADSKKANEAPAQAAPRPAKRKSDQPLGGMGL
jgi:hypothetical protein